MADDYCDLCDLPKSTCVHGMPPPPPPAPAAPRASRVTTPRAPRKVAEPAAPTRRAPRKWTPPDALAPHIVAVLEEAAGPLDADDLFERLEARLSDELLDGDRELTPEGELRWRYAARRARQALIKDGVMSKGTPGRWALG